MDRKRVGIVLFDDIEVLDFCPRLDIVVAPGGWGTRTELKNPIMLDWLRARAAEAEIVTRCEPARRCSASRDF